MTENFSRSAVNTRIFIFQRRKTRNISFESRDRKQRRLSRVFSQNAPITRPYRCTLQSPSNLRRNLKVELVIFRLASLSPTGIIAFASVKASLTAIKLRFENLQVSLCVCVYLCVVASFPGNRINGHIIIYKILFIKKKEKEKKIRTISVFN